MRPRQLPASSFPVGGQRGDAAGDPGRRPSPEAGHAGTLSLGFHLQSRECPVCRHTQRVTVTAAWWTREPQPVLREQVPAPGTLLLTFEGNKDDKTGGIALKVATEHNWLKGTMQVGQPPCRENQRWDREGLLSSGRRMGARPGVAGPGSRGRGCPEALGQGNPNGPVPPTGSRHQEEEMGRSTRLRITDMVLKEGVWAPHPKKVPGGTWTYRPSSDVAERAGALPKEVCPPVRAAEDFHGDRQE